MKKEIIKIINYALKKIGLNKKVTIKLIDPQGHGDFSTNIAMKIAQKEQLDPFLVANKIKNNIDSDLIDTVKVAKPGFINIFLKNNVFAKIIYSIINNNKNFGKGQEKSYINLEYVSANPTGYLHLGHARGAAVGSALVNILRFAGNKVDAEYYINDVGNQVNLLGLSVFIRYQNLLGNKEFKLPEDSYKGEEIKDCAQFLKNKFNDKYKDNKYEEVDDIFQNESKAYMLDFIKKHLSSYNVKMDYYVAESEMYKNNKIKKMLNKISDHTFEKDGALWIDTKSQGDDKNRVLVKSDKTLTYFTPDLTYHNDKVERGYDELIDIWGADHIGYIKRMKIGLGYLGMKQDKLDILTVQTVKLFKDGKELKMSKRSGTSYTIEGLIKEVGVDAARWYMLNRSMNSQLIFNINNALKRTNDNPIFTVQYTYARICQLMKKSTIKIKPSCYEENSEIKIINFLSKFPDVIKKINKNHKVHTLTNYILDLCSLFNSWYSTSRAIGNKRESSLLALALATKIVIKNGLDLLEISTPEKM